MNVLVPLVPFMKKEQQLDERWKMNCGGRAFVGWRTSDGVRTSGERTSDGARMSRERTSVGARTSGERTSDGARTRGKRTSDGETSGWRTSGRGQEVGGRVVEERAAGEQAAAKIQAFYERQRYK